MSGRWEAVAVLVGSLALSACSPSETVFDGFGDDARKLRVVNRDVDKRASINQALAD